VDRTYHAVMALNAASCADMAFTSGEPMACGTEAEEYAAFTAAEPHVSGTATPAAPSEAASSTTQAPPPAAQAAAPVAAGEPITTLSGCACSH
jgi:hypothetical protein